jgi:hypothetical protein
VAARKLIQVLRQKQRRWKAKQLRLAQQGFKPKLDASSLARTLIIAN